jgi:peptide/nickel transport system substrate-binding protein
MRRHWRKTTIALAGVALIAAVASSASATSVPPPSEPAGTEPAGTEPAGTEPAGTEPAGTEPASTEPAGTAAPGTTGAPAGSAPAGEMLLSYDESASCGTETNTSNIAKLEAPDPLTFVLTLCNSDPAIPAKVPFAALGIAPSEYLENTDGLINEPIGTGPYMLSAWERGSQIVLEANPDYWGEPAATPTAVIQWNPESAQRLVQLQSGAATAIDNVGTNDIAAIESNPDLQLIPREPLNVFYVGFNVDMEPFNDPVLRQAVSIGIDRQRIVDTFYPAGSQVATQFLPPGIPGYDDSFVDFQYDPETAAQMVAEAYPDGVEVNLSYRQEARPYLAQPTEVATDIQAQLADIGITANLDVQESTTFIDNVNSAQLPFYLLGWGADFPDPSNFIDYHFGPDQIQFGTGFQDIYDAIAAAASEPDPDARLTAYQQVNPLLAEHIPVVPIAYGGSAMAYQAGVQNAHASPLTTEILAVMSLEGADQFVLVQNGEPGGLWCPDETDGETLRVCEQMTEQLLAYEVGGTESVPSLAESWEANEDFTVWTFHLREGVTFHDGSEFDAVDVVENYRVQWDAADPRHVGRTGDFQYWGALFGGFLNPPPAEEE